MTRGCGDGSNRSQLRRKGRMPSSVSDMKSGGNHFRLLAAACVVLATTLTACSSGATPSTTTGPATLDAAVTSTFGPATPFSPASAAVNGSTDVYHCFLVDPHLTTD